LEVSGRGEGGSTSQENHIIGKKGSGESQVTVSFWFRGGRGGKIESRKKSLVRGRAGKGGPAHTLFGIEKYPSITEKSHGAQS